MDDTGNVKLLFPGIAPPDSSLQPEIHAEIVRFFQEKLDAAQRGEIAAAAMVTVTPGDDAMLTWLTGPVSGNELIGAVAKLQFAMIAASMAEE